MLPEHDITGLSYYESDLHSNSNSSSLGFEYREPQLGQVVNSSLMLTNVNKTTLDLRVISS